MYSVTVKSPGFVSYSILIVLFTMYVKSSPSSGFCRWIPNRYGKWNWVKHLIGSLITLTLCRFSINGRSNSDLHTFSHVEIKLCKYSSPYTLILRTEWQCCMFPSFCEMILLPRKKENDTFEKHIDSYFRITTKWWKYWRFSSYSDK